VSAAASPLRPVLVFSAVVALTVTTLFAGCGSGGDATGSKPDGTAPGYCLQRCQGEDEAGTLAGTYQECLDECCQAVPSGCQGLDAGGGDAPPGEDAAGDSGGNTNPDAYVRPEAGGDGPTGDGPTGDGGCAQPCGNVCCFGSEVCVAGACTTACTTNSDCPQTAPCCAIQANGGPTGCVNQTEDQGCACATSSDCATLGCCAPATNAAGDPVGPYICKPDDGNSYDCCTGITTTCSGNFCCVKDSNGNEFCSLPCTPGDTTCGAAHCDPFTFGIETTCSGSNACGP
jgi:hypothetical protein